MKRLPLLAGAIAACMAPAPIRAQISVRGSKTDCNMALTTDASSIGGGAVPTNTNLTFPCAVRWQTTQTAAGNPYSIGNVAAKWFYQLDFRSAPLGNDVWVSSCTNCTNHPASSYVKSDNMCIATPSSGFVDVWWMYKPTPTVTVNVTKVDDSGATGDPAGATISVTPAAPNCNSGGTLAAGVASASIVANANVPYTVTSSAPAGYSVFHAICAPNCSWVPGPNVAFATPSTGSVDVRFKYSPFTVAAVSPLLKVQPATAPPYPRVGLNSNDPTVALLSAARNEFEPFQVVLYNPGLSNVVGIEFSSAGLTGPQGATVPPDNIRFYRQAYLNIAQTSNLEAISGLIPDPLIPKQDEGYAGGQSQVRPAFYHFLARTPAEDAGCTSPVPPVASNCNVIPPKENRAVWVDVLVPPRQPDGSQTPPGLYTGTVDASWTGGAQSITMNLSVFDFDLPSTSSLISRYDISSNQICAAHFPGGGCDEPGMRRLYARQLLDHRISSSALMVSGFTDPGIPNFTDTAQPWGNWRNYYASLVEGTPSASMPALLKGSQLTMVNYAWGHPDVLDAGQSSVDANRHATWKANLGQPIPNTTKTWFSRTLDYICDEPSRPNSDCSWAKAGQVDGSGNLRCAVAGDPPTILTRRAQNASTFWTFTASSVDDVVCHDPNSYTSDVSVIGPVVDQMDNKDVDPNGVRPANAGYQRAKYDVFKETWWYQSCDLQGCSRNAFNGAANPGYYDAWPSTRIDAPTMHQHRAQEWLSYVYRTTGEFYYDVATQLPTSWSSLPPIPGTGIGGNGDGNLMYPGTPARVSPCDPANPPTCSSMALGPDGGSHIPIASLRLKMIREGMEDYEYLKMAEDLDPAATPDGRRLFARQYSEPLFDPNALLGATTAVYHSYNSGKATGMLGARGSGQDLTTARQVVADHIQQLAAGHSIATTLVANTPSTSTYRVDTTSNPAGAPLTMSCPWSAVQLSNWTTNAGAPLTATVNGACPAPQLSSFTVTAMRPLTQQERTALSYLPQSFSVSPKPATRSVSPGSTASYVISTSMVGTSPTAQIISSFSVPSLPSGVTVQSFSPQSVQAGQSTTMTLNVAPTVPVAAYSISVNANGCETKSTSITLNVCTPVCDSCGVPDGCGGICPTCPPPPPPGCKPGVIGNRPIGC